MMGFHSIALYIAILTAIIYCPGPMMMFCMANSIKRGPRAVLPALWGGSSAYIVQLIVVSLGLGLLLRHSVEAFDIIKWIGAAYLIYLGLKQWWSKDVNVKKKALEEAKRYSAGKMYFQGFLVGATNPKSIIIFTALFPQFIDPHEPHLPQLLVLSILFLVIQFFGALSYTYFGGEIFKWLKKRKKEKLIRRIAGTILIAAGILLASVRE